MTSPPSWRLCWEVMRQRNATRCAWQVCVHFLELVSTLSSANIFRSNHLFAASLSCLCATSAQNCTHRKHCPLLRVTMTSVADVLFPAAPGNKSLCAPYLTEFSLLLKPRTIVLTLSSSHALSRSAVRMYAGMMEYCMMKHLRYAGQ